MLADRVEDDVVRLAVLREVLLQVVDDLVGAERAHELDVLRVADRGDVGAEVLGELHSRRPDRPGGAVDEDALPFQIAGLSQARERERRSVADRRGLVEGHARRHVRERAALPDADELGVRARADAEDAVADLELGDGRADRLDLAGQLQPEDLLLRPEQAGEEAADEDLGAAKSAVGPGDRGCVDPDEDLVVLGDGPLDLLESQDLRRPVPVVDDGLHARSAAVHGQDDVSRLLPRLDVPRRLDDVLQRVPAVDDRPVLPRLDELLDEEDVLLRVLRYRERHLLVADPAGQQAPAAGRAT